MNEESRNVNKKKRNLRNIHNEKKDERLIQVQIVGVQNENLDDFGLKKREAQ